MIDTKKKDNLTELEFHHLYPSKKEFALSDINFNASSFNMEMLKEK